MNILWPIHLYPPKHNCGAEYAAHFINKFLIAQGHNVRVIIYQAEQNRVKVPYVFDGVEVFGTANFVDPSETHSEGSAKLDPYRWADVIISHLDYSAHTRNICRVLRKPFIHLAHSSHIYESQANMLQGMPPHATVYNAKWVAEKLAYKMPSMVLYPPVDPNYYNVCENPEKNEYIALINLNENKGGHIFYEIAKAMPDKKFLGIKGSYEEQIMEDLPNVMIVENTSEIRKYYKQIRILLMPSKYESWGRTATEAMANGIPVIFNWTPGLNENIGPDAGLVVTDRDCISSWMTKIKLLDNKKTYAAFSKASRARAAELWETTQNQLQEFHKLLLSLIHGRSGNL